MSARVCVHSICVCRCRETCF